MSSPPPKTTKRKWDQPAGDESGSTPSSKVAKTDESKTASEAAAAAAAIAAKIAAQFASGVLGGDGEEFTQDIDINDVRNRYLLTKGSTQEQVCLDSHSGRSGIDVHFRSKTKLARL